jgi:hypothetical protein
MWSLSNVSHYAAALFVGFVMLLAFMSPVAAQCPEQWLTGHGIPGVNGEVNAVVKWDPDGAGPKPELLVVGGNFTTAGTVRANRIAAWDGTAWQTLGAGISNGQVLALDRKSVV